MSHKVSLATFGAGCFWSVELSFQRLEGVLKTTVGYANGTLVNPTYKDVCSGKTGHVEAVQIEYDEAKIQYPTLLKNFWEIHDPTTLNRQKNDIGTQYRSGIYYHTENQALQAEESKQHREKEIKKLIVTEIMELKSFYPAEECHQRYLEKGGQCASKGCNDPIRCYG